MFNFPESITKNQESGMLFNSTQNLKLCSNGNQDKSKRRNNLSGFQVNFIQSTSLFHPPTSNL